MFIIIINELSYFFWFTNNFSSCLLPLSPSSHRLHQPLRGVLRLDTWSDLREEQLDVGLNLPAKCGENRENGIPDDDKKIQKAQNVVLT